MTKALGILSVLVVILMAMGFAAANAGQTVTLVLGIVTLYQVPVTLVAFFGVLMGMLVMFATGVHSDLKVRRILRERLADESRREQRWIDGNQVDLFAGGGTLETTVRAQGEGREPHRVGEDAPPPESTDGAPPMEADGPRPDEAGSLSVDGASGLSSGEADGPAPEDTSGPRPEE